MFDLKDLMSRVNLPQDITRRGFLQVATVTAAFAAMNQSRAQTGAQPYIILETPKGLIVGDPSLCVDCQRCEMACTEFNDGKNDPPFSIPKQQGGGFKPPPVLVSTIF